MKDSDPEADIVRLGTKTVYENRWMCVREDDVRFADGSRGIYGVVDKPDFAAIVPLEDDGRIHLVQQYRYPVQGRYWEIPQGSWETRPDVEPETVALAELAEETGLRAGTLEPLSHLFQAYGYSSQGFHLFLATGLEAGETGREATEHDMVCRAFTLEQIVSMIETGEVRDVTTIAAIGLLRLTGRI